jgi:hypothetical protein
MGVYVWESLGIPVDARRILDARSVGHREHTLYCYFSNGNIYEIRKEMALAIVS